MSAPRSFVEIRSGYENNPDAVGLENPTSANSDGDTLLHLAAFQGNESDVRDLLALGSRPDVHGDLGNTPLHYAGIGGHIGVASALLAVGAKHDVKNEFGETPADCAALGKHHGLVTLLRSPRRRRRSK
jgi:ankyrin repeat protein